MKTTWIALTLAALAAAPAAAQFDASSAAKALAAVQALRAAQAAKKQGPAAAKPVPPSAPDAAWQKVVEAVKAKGKYTPEAPPFRPGDFTLEDVVGDKDADHREENASAFGAINDDEQFEVMGFGFMSDEWKKAADGTWTVDRWIFEADPYGTVSGAAHVTVTLGADKKPAGPEALKQDAALKPTDPRIAQKYQAIIAHWSAPRP